MARETEDKSTDDGQLAAFVRVREAQAQTHFVGRPAREAFSNGRCHVLAIEVASRTGLPMVALTPIGYPRHLNHVGVLDGEHVIDADGHTRSEVWRARWESKDPDMTMRVVDRAELSDMMAAHVPVNERELEASRPLADAVLSARWTDERLWSLAPRPNPSKKADDAPEDDSDHASAMREALSGTMDDLVTNARAVTEVREDRARRGVTLRSCKAVETARMVDVMASTPMRRDGAGRVALLVTRDGLKDALNGAVTDEGRRLKWLVYAARQPGDWPGMEVMAPEQIHEGFLGAMKLSERFGTTGGQRRLWCDPGELAKWTVETDLGWEGLAEMLDLVPAPDRSRRREEDVPMSVDPSPMSENDLGPAIGP